MNKELHISAKLEADNGTFDSAVRKIQQILSTISKDFRNSMANAFGGKNAASGGGANTSMAMESFTKTMEDLRKKSETNMRNYASRQMRIMKDIVKEEQTRSQLIKQQDELTKNKIKDLKEELRIKKELKDSEEKITTLIQRGTSGGPGSGGGGGGKTSNMRKGMASISAILMAASKGLDMYASLPLTEASAAGSATQSLITNQAQELFNNPISYMAWNPERQKAMQYAMKKMKYERAEDVLSASAAGVGAVGGAALGGPIGGAIGGAAGLVGGAFVSQGRSTYLLAEAMTKTLSKGFELVGKSHTLLGEILKPIVTPIGKALGNVSNSLENTYNAKLMEHAGQNFTAMLESQKKLSPGKQMALDYWQNNYMKNLQAQRMMGLSDEGLMGPKGFFQNITNSGFSTDMGLQMANAIGAAGGSTRAMRGSSALALQAARGFGLTNAGQVMGTISAGAGSAESSNAILKSILAEGVKEGLDKSNAVAELRRFSEQTATVISATGATSQFDIANLLQGFGRFQEQGGIPTTVQQQASMSAYNQYQQLTSTTSGRAGSMQYAAFANSAIGRKMQPRQISALMSMSENQITSTNPEVVALASELGMKPEDVVTQVMQNKRTGAAATAMIDKGDFSALSKAGIKDVLSIDQLNKLKNSKKKTDQSAYKAYQDVMWHLQYTGKYNTAPELEAAFRNYSTLGIFPSQGNGAGGKTPPPSPEMTKVTDQLAKVNRDADKAVQELAVASQAAVDNFNKVKDALIPLNVQTSEYAKRVALVLEAYANAKSVEEKTAAAHWGIQYITGSLTQTQGGKPKPGGH